MREIALPVIEKVEQHDMRLPEIAQDRISFGVA